MKLTADTNVLVRALVQDDPDQGAAAADTLTTADLIAVPVPCVCELAWVLRSVYGFGASEIAAAIRALLHTENVRMNRPAVEAGLALLEAGGDFADGAIAYEGKWLGAGTFVSFDRKAVALLTTQGRSARLLSGNRDHR